jgi:hypothetical protein
MFVSETRYGHGETLKVLNSGFSGEYTPFIGAPGRVVVCDHLSIVVENEEIFSKYLFYEFIIEIMSR